ncbi:Acetolactate synthase [Fusarium agapanthi]|uniref:Acetolactate synthase n=1 Tax=Fusarium agapanthi TaxID=1803897 RepID=A0A9P5EEG0_9HYPO|nr:Acetolactate synthase [Fusarium agapanthi]
MQTYAEDIVQSLSSFGCDKAFGVSGTNINHIWKALHRPDIAVYNFAHESGAAFAAAEYSIQTGNFVIVFVTSGPGITNSITRLRCARADGARIVFIAGLTSEETGRTGRRLNQETFPMDVMGLTGPTVDSALSYCVIVRDGFDVWRLRQTLVRIKRDPLGGVLGVFLTDAKSKSFTSPLQQRPNFELCPFPTLSKEALDVCKEVVEMLKTKRSVLWIGYGCRGASALVRQLAERYALPVLATPRAKGIFPETHRLYQGTTGLGASLNPMMRTNPPTGVLLGSKATELSSRFIQEEWVDTDFYCVSLETSEVKRNMPKGSAFIQAEISLFLGAVLEVEDTGQIIAYPLLPKAIIPPIPAPSRGRIHPATVMSVVQDVAINRCGRSIIADAGRRKQSLLDSPLPEILQTWALSIKPRFLSLSDAAMLKQSEVSTAVLYGSRAIWLVMNSSQYGTIDQLTRTWGDVPPPYSIPYTDFELLARAVLCEGFTVTEENGLRKALGEALVRDGPTVINVLIDSPPMAPLEP